MSNQEKKASKNYVLPIAIMYSLFFMIAFVTGYQNPLGDVIKKMTGDNVVMSQLGTFANFIAYAIMGYPAGRLLERSGYRSTALIAVSVGFAGVLVTYLSGFIADNTTAVTIYLLGAFIAGFSMCLLNTVVNPMLNSLGKNENQGNQLVQFGGACNSTGATLAPMIVGGLIGGSASTIASANPVFYLAMGIFVIAFLVIYFTKLPEAPDFGKAKKEKIQASGAFRYRNFTFGIIAIFLYLGIEVGVPNIVFQYLSTNPDVVTNNPGMSATAIAGTIAGLYWFLMLIGRLVGGSIGSKVSSRAMLLVASIGALVLVACGIILSGNYVSFFGFDSKSLSFLEVKVPLNTIFLICIGLCTSVMWGAIFNLSQQGLGKYSQFASGMFMVMVCGGGILPTLQAWMGGHIGVLNSFWMLAGISVYLIVYSLFLSRPNKNLPQSDEKLYENGEEVVA